MESRWDQSIVDSIDEDDLSMRVYTSNLLGSDEDLVLHGGGNTSVKSVGKSIFGDTESVLFIKGSGWDLRSIEKAGFPATRMEQLLKLCELESLTDTEMMSQLRLSLLDPKSPTPSVEAILHALIPYKFVDHTHADAVVTISNSPNGKETLNRLFGDEVLILPYVMPGFILAKQVATATESIDWSAIKGIVLLNHGILTFGDDAKTSYDSMINLVDTAEKFLLSKMDEHTIARVDVSITEQDCLQLTQLRRRAGEFFEGPVLVRLNSSDTAVGFSALYNFEDLITRGPLTPDHTIHTKAFGAAFHCNPSLELENFRDKYERYFVDHASEGLQMLDLMPRFGAWQNKGLIYFSGNVKRLNVIENIVGHTIKAIQLSEAIGGWCALPKEKLFEVEYWELEQAKLKTNKANLAFEGKVALVTGAASGIGEACVTELSAQGAAVIALDIDPRLGELFQESSVFTQRCDVTSTADIQASLLRGVQHFGGLDILISNAGIFPESQYLESTLDEAWLSSLDVNLSSHMKMVRACVPYLKLGFDPSVVIMASKNVPAPGPGAGAYSVAKAGLTQFARVAALELGEYGIRVNVLHPNAVYDTAIWSDDVLKARASSYGLSVEEYKKSNVLKQEVASRDVAIAAALFAGKDLKMTTGAQIPIDGGNERVI